MTKDETVLSTLPLFGEPKTAGGYDSIQRPVFRARVAEIAAEEDPSIRTALLDRLVDDVVRGTGGA